MSDPNPYKPPTDFEIAKNERKGLLEFSRFDTFVGDAFRFILSAFAMPP
ncbi:hypothetical protein [Stieleria magnilauensis]|uniref:Uncharacterized protein n=1 Tax=Stieleria magnilauensis TaxID=2527963 RepID=A0ABX5XVK9_9BACT|nr:hypothetical protein TBK1r_50860 [Planctomycetes bacterium TBK1r]